MLFNRGVQGSSVLTDFPSTHSVVIERGGEITCKRGRFSSQPCGVSLPVPRSSVIRCVHVLDCYILPRISPFVIMKWPSLSLVIVFVPRSALSDSA